MKSVEQTSQCHHAQTEASYIHTNRRDMCCIKTSVRCYFGVGSQSMPGPERGRDREKRWMGLQVIQRVEGGRGKKVAKQPRAMGVG